MNLLHDLIWGNLLGTSGGGSGGGGADWSSLDILVADFATDPPTVTNGALDGWNRAVAG